MKRFFAYFGVLLVLIVCGCTSNNKDYASMNTMPLRTVCAGRISLDIPKNGVITWSQRIGDAEVTRLPPDVNSLENFWKVVELRRDELAAQKHDTESSLLSDYQRVGDNAAVLLFRDAPFQDATYHLDRYVWTGQFGYRLKTDAILDSDAKANMPAYKQVLHQFEPTDNAELPSKPGFCIDQAIVTDPIRFISAGPLVRLTQWKGVDVYAGVREPVDPNDTDTPYRDLGNLEDGAKESMSEAASDSVSSFTVLRKHERTANGFLGQETAFKATLANGQVYYQLRWATLPKEAGLKQGIVMGLNAGSPYTDENYVAPPTEDELFALWDAMLNSIKLRRGAY